MRNNKWTRAIAMGLVATMTAGVLAGCGGSSETGGTAESAGTSNGGSDVVTLTMSCWDDQQAKVMETIGAAYTEANPNVVLDVQVTTWTEYWTKLEASATSGDAPDLFWVNVLHAEEYATAGIMKDLTAVGEAIDVNANYPAALVNGYTYGEKLWAIPKDFDTNGVFYNKEIFDAVGVEYPTDDMTFEDFKAKVVELQEAGLDEGVYPIAVPRNSGQTTYYSSIAANGGYILSPDKTTSGWNMPETYEAIQPWLDLVLEGYSPNPQQMADTSTDAMFAAGKLAMLLAGNYMIPEFATTLETSKFDVATRPSFNGKGTDIINGLGYAVSEFTKHEAEALAFVEYLGGSEAMILQAEGKKVIPARNDAQELYLDAYPELNLGIFLANLDETKLFDFCSITSQLSDIEKRYLDPVWNGEDTLESATAKIVAEEQPLLDELNGK